MGARARVHIPNAGKSKRSYNNNGRRRNPRNEFKHKKMPQTQPDEDRFFVIEKLLDKRYNHEFCYHEYLVRWQNYPPDWDSWEPAHELERNSLDLINEFNKIGRDDQEYRELHCTCRRPYRFDQGGMIQCFNCLTWFHFSCLGMNMEEANSFAKYYCDDCRLKNPTFKNMYKEKTVVHFYSQE